MTKYLSNSKQLTGNNGNGKGLPREPYSKHLMYTPPHNTPFPDTSCNQHFLLFLLRRSLNPQWGLLNLFSDWDVTDIRATYSSSTFFIPLLTPPSFLPTQTPRRQQDRERQVTQGTTHSQLYKEKEEVKRQPTPLPLSPPTVPEDQSVFSRQDITDALLSERAIDKE